MTAGIFVCPEGSVHTSRNWVRPRSKKQVRELVEDHPYRVRVEFTDIQHRGPGVLLVTELGANREIYFVGPDPFQNRRFYGRVTTDLEGRARVI